MRFVLVSVLLGACAPSSSVLVDAHTDLDPGREFDTVRVTVGDGAHVYAATDDDWLTGRRLGPFAVSSGPVTLEAALLFDGEVVVRRVMQFRVTDAAVVPVWLLRSCRDVVCPTAADPSATECADGTCVPPDCVDGEESCPIACTSELGCPLPTAACAARACVSGHCVIASRVGACPLGEACDPDAGCVRDVRPDAGASIDAGARDVPGPACADPCDDGDPCTYADACDGDTCRGTAIGCTSDPCVTRTCNGTASCTTTIEAGRACDDDGDPCTRDVCGGGGNCRHDPADGASCPGGVCCGGTCLADDPSSCGACGVACGEGEVCSDGRCTCGGLSGGPGGGAVCAGARPGCCAGTCVDLDSDYLNCGTCGLRCGDQYGDCIGSSCGCGTDPRCTGVVQCCRCGPGGMGSYCALPGDCPC